MAGPGPVQLTKKSNSIFRPTSIGYSSIGCRLFSSSLGFIPLERNRAGCSTDLTTHPLGCCYLVPKNYLITRKEPANNSGGDGRLDTIITAYRTVLTLTITRKQQPHLQFDSFFLRPLTLTETSGSWAAAWRNPRAGHVSPGNRGGRGRGWTRLNSQHLQHPVLLVCG